MSLNPKIDFEVIDNGNPNILMVIDSSDWGVIIDKQSIIEITLPGYTDKTTKWFDKKSVNIFNSLNLSASCVDCGEELQSLPDGIYTITVKGSPDKFNKTKYFFKTSTIDLDIAEMYITKGVKDVAIYNKLKKIDYKMTLATAFIKQGDFNSAGEFYEKARVELDEIKNCK